MTELEELYEFFYLTPVGLAKVSFDGVVEQINPFMVNILMSIDNEYSVHNNFFKSISKYDVNLKELSEKLIENKNERDINNYIMTINDKSIKKLRLKCGKITGDRFIMVLENITEFVTASEEKDAIELELDNQKERLAKIGQVIRMVVHDLRNPLSNIKTISDMVELASVEEARELLQENINVILDEINGIIGDMLDYTRAEIPKLVPVSIAVINYHLSMKFDLMMKESGVTIEYYSVDDFDLLCEESKIVRVFNNIVGNAIKALVSHKISNPVIKVTIEKSNENALITIKDNGDGIPDELIGKLFEPFAFKSGYVGNGIGLPIVKSIIDMHNGSISVTSGKDGTEFKIMIPLAVS